MTVPELAEFVRHRPMLFGLAYRLTGSAHDADDVLQEAYLRWAGADRSAVAQPRRYLTRVVARLALDQLRARRARRESYVGEWLPEPVATDPSPFGTVDTSDLSIAVLHLMEQLTAPQRAVFVLRSAFDLPYEEIAGIVERTVADCRQLYHRAQRALRDGRTRFAPTPAEQRRLLADFVAAAREGDPARLHRLLRADAVAWSDGGGQVRSARRPIRSAAKVARFFASIYSRPPALRAVAIEINAAPAMLIGYPRPRHLLVLDVDADGIRGIFVLANPDKLAAVFTGDRCGPDMIEPGCGRPGVRRSVTRAVDSGGVTERAPVSAAGAPRRDGAQDRQRSPGPAEVFGRMAQVTAERPDRESTTTAKGRDRAGRAAASRPSSACRRA